MTINTIIYNSIFYIKVVIGLIFIEIISKKIKRGINFILRADTSVYPNVNYAGITDTLFLVFETLLNLTTPSISA